jgi:hypothetical protein
MTLFDIELKSHWLKEQLHKPGSIRARLLYLSEFLTGLLKSGNQSKYISYYNEFWPELVDLILQLSQPGDSQYFSPEEINNLLFIIGSLEVFITTEEKLEKCKSILTGVNKEILATLNANDSEKTGSSRDSIPVVLIEKNGDHKIKIGTVQRLEIHSSKRRKEFNKDKIDFENHFEINAEKLSAYISSIISLAKERTKKNIHKINSYNFSYSYQNKNYSYSGFSFGVALFALAYNSILINELYKTYYKFYDDVVFTGEIDENGNLLNLDSFSLKVKIETVFFSRFKKFVIPEDNIIEAKEALNQLQKKYPLRKLELIPIANIKSIFQNLEIVELCELRLKEKLKANYDRYHRTFNWAFTFTALITIAYLIINYAIPYMDKNPVYTNLKNNQFFAYNKYGNIVWRSPTLSEQDIYLYKYDVEGRMKRIMLTDLDGDGFNDILFLISNDKNKLMNRTLFCYNHDGSIKWETHISPKDSIYGNDYCSNDILIRMMFLLNTNGKKEIVVNYRVCELFPDYTDKINNKGEIVSEFYNPGATRSFISYDIDNDGKHELFSGGINNDFDKSGALIVFDADFIKGRGPGYRFPRNFSNGVMKYYLLFPRTDVGRFTNYGTSEIEGVNINDDKIIVYLKELDTFVSLKNETGLQAYTTIFTLDKFLNVLHVETSSEFDNKYRQLVDEGKLKPVKDWKKYKEKLKSLVKYWDGDKFVNYPVLNRYYLLAKNQSNLKSVNK